VTIRPAYDQPRPLAYINKVIQQYHRLPHITLTRYGGYHTLTYDTLDEGGIYEEHSIMVPYTNDLTLGAWVNAAISFNDDVLEINT
jgi:hypothetical protein